MTATDELRRLLDEAGVEYRFNDATKVFEWHFDGTDGEGSAHATEVDGGINIMACSITPEQAIAATLGRGTCHNTQLAEMDEKAEKKHRMAIASVLYGGIFPEDEPAEFTCSACGKTALIDWVTLYDIRFCPFCGAKVVVP